MSLNYRQKQSKHHFVKPYTHINDHFFTFNKKLFKACGENCVITVTMALGLLNYTRTTRPENNRDDLKEQISSHHRSNPDNVHY